MPRASSWRRAHCTCSRPSAPAEPTKVIVCPVSVEASRRGSIEELATNWIGLFLPDGSYAKPLRLLRLHCGGGVEEEAGAGKRDVGAGRPSLVEGPGIVVAPVGDDPGRGRDLAYRGDRLGVRLHIDDDRFRAGALVGRGGKPRVRYRGRDLRAVEQVTDEGGDGHPAPRMCCARYVASPSFSIRSSCVSSQSIDCSPSASIGSKIRREPSSPTSRQSAIEATSASTVAFSSMSSFRNWSVTPDPTRIRLSRWRLGVPSK